MGKQTRYSIGEASHAVVDILEVRVSMRETFQVDNDEFKWMLDKHGLAATADAMQVIAAWAVRAFHPLPGDQPSLSEPLARTGYRWSEDCRPFFVTLSDGRLAPSPALISLTGPV